MRDIKDTVIRDATDFDMAEVQRIYQHHVLNGLATFEEVPPTLDEMRRRRDAVLASGLPYLVADIDGGVTGYCYATSYGRDRPTATPSRTQCMCRKRCAAAASARCCSRR
jgi:L-amino acid N-acyltransferase YncA